MTKKTEQAKGRPVVGKRLPKAESAAVASNPKKAGRPVKGATKSATVSSKSTTEVKPTRAKSKISTAKSTVKPVSTGSKTDVLENLGSLPHSYGSDVIYLVAQEPNWLFTYWDIDISRHPGGPCRLRVEEADGHVDQEIEVPFESRNWYIPVKKAGGTYMVDIGFYRQGGWNSLSRSALVTTPSNTMSRSDDFRFATVPLHMEFHRLVEAISRSMDGASDLVPALSSMAMALPGEQAAGEASAERERELLVSLLGSDSFGWLSSGSWSSEEIHSAVRQRILEQAHSGALAEMVGRIQLAQAESSLFSSVVGRGGESLSSFWNMGAWGSEQLAVGVSSWVTAALASWAGAAKSRWESSSAGVSWAAGMLSSGSIPTSWAGAESSGAAASLGGLASWAVGAESSWAGIGLSSLELSVLSSWSEAFSSSMGGPASSSWGSSEQSSSFAVPRGMHAEITLRGRAEPGGCLRIGDHTIRADGNGDFEHRLVLDGARREVSIRAIPSQESSELHP